MPPLLTLASQEGDAPGPVAAREAIRKVISAVAEDGLYLMIAQVCCPLVVCFWCARAYPQSYKLFASQQSRVAAQLEKGLEDSARRRASANAIAHFCSSTRLDFQEHVPSLLTVCPPPISLGAACSPPWLTHACPGSHPALKK